LADVTELTLAKEQMGDEFSVETADVIHVAAFRAALRSFLRTSEQIAQANGLTPQRHLLLLMIKGAPDGSERATVTDLAERLQLAQSSVTELAMRAEQTGLIERERSDVDARVAHLRLTEEGERRLARVFQSHEAERQELQEILAELDERARAATARSSITTEPLHASATGSSGCDQTTQGEELHDGCH
jgi:DNA-binding MarR family transcriptional regulator